VCVYTQNTYMHLYTCTVSFVLEAKITMRGFFLFFVGWGAVKRQKSFPSVPLTTPIEPNGALSRVAAFLCLAK
jgi:hypothetical protein